jgi:hypothetical protein
MEFNNLFKLTQLLYIFFIRCLSLRQRFWNHSFRRLFGRFTVYRLIKYFSFKNMKKLRLDWRKTRYDNSKTVAFKLQSMQKCFMSKLYILRETTLFSQGCTIFIVFVTAHLLWAFKELNISKSIPKLQIIQQHKTFWRCKLSFYLCFILCSLHSCSNSTSRI